MLITSTFTFSQKKELQNRITSDQELTINKGVSIELNSGSIIKGELTRVDEINKVIIIQNASDSTEIKFKNIYKVHDGDKSRSLDYMYRIDVPERFFYNPMGNTMPKGMVSLENVFIINNSLKVGVTDRLEAGLGFTMYASEDEDSTVSALPMASIKYKYIDRRHLKASIGATTLQMPPVFSLTTGVLSNRKPWFNIMYASANWEYKYATFSFAAAQPFINTFALRSLPSISFNDNGLDYMFSGSFSIKAFPFAHFVSENIFLSGAWNTLGQPNTIKRETYLIPLVGGRYYGDYYSFAGGFSNILIPNAVVFFYIGGAYYFQ